jgi:hypothetical protein
MGSVLTIDTFSVRSHFVAHPNFKLIVNSARNYSGAHHGRKSFGNLRLGRRDGKTKGLMVGS